MFEPRIGSGNPSRHREKSRWQGGLFYLLTFVSIPQFILYASVRNPNYIVGPGPDTGVIIGGILEIIVALAGIGTAVALFPAVKRQNESVALGFVGSRTLEAATIFAGVVCVMTMVTLRKSGIGAEALLAGRALIALYDWFHLGQAVMPAVNDLLLGYLLYQSRMVPRMLPVLAFIGVPILYSPHVQHHRSSLHPDHVRRSPDRAVRVFAGRLPNRQRLQTHSYHC